MTILKNKESPIQHDESSKTVSTANTSMLNSTNSMENLEVRKMLKRVWKCILVGDLSKLKSLQLKLISAG